MADDSIWRSHVPDARAGVLEERWQQLCAAYLPLAQKDSIWRYHRAADPKEPACGWKLHVSATILNAPAILKRIAPVLADRSVQFKAARSLVEVNKLNSGLYYSYSQIGKIITVYPRSESEAVSLAQRLDELTWRFKGPSVPFDFRFRRTSNIYYRFGAFRHLEIEEANGRRTPAISSPTGELVPDSRESGKPDWVRDPFEGQRPISREREDSRGIPFRVLRALVQRGKGGVYQAIDLRTTPPRLCLLKEGRKNGEMTWDGRDGAWRVRNEERVLSQLLAYGVATPEVYSSFELKGNYYLAMKFIDGETLHKLLSRFQRRMPVVRVLSYGVQLATFLSRMHRAGWAWRDCKPKNILVKRQGTLVPIDFEGACPIDKPDPLRWGTSGFVPPESPDGFHRTGADDDLYALGSILYLLLTGRVFDAAQPVAIEKLRPKVPPEVAELVAVLLRPDWDDRPDAQTASAQLESALARMSKKRPKRRASIKRPGVNAISLVDAKAA
jgi:hypothetical protein